MIKNLANLMMMLCIFSLLPFTSATLQAGLCCSRPQRDSPQQTTRSNPAYVPTDVKVGVNTPTGSTVNGRVVPAWQSQKPSAAAASVRDSLDNLDRPLPPLPPRNLPKAVGGPAAPPGGKPDVVPAANFGPDHALSMRGLDVVVEGVFGVLGAPPKQESEVADAQGVDRSQAGNPPASTFEEVYRNAMSTLYEENAIPASATDQNAVAQGIEKTLNEKASSNEKLSPDVVKAMMIATTYLYNRQGGAENLAIASAFEHVSAFVGGAAYRSVLTNDPIRANLSEMYYLDKVYSQNMTSHLTRTSSYANVDRAAITAWSQKMASNTFIDDAGNDLPISWSTLLNAFSDNLAVDGNQISYTTASGEDVIATKGDKGWDGSAVDKIVSDLAAGMYATGVCEMGTLSAATAKLSGVFTDQREGVAMDLFNIAASFRNEQGETYKTIDGDPIRNSAWDSHGPATLPGATVLALRNALGRGRLPGDEAVGYLSRITPDISQAIKSVAQGLTVTETRALIQALANIQPSADGAPIGDRNVLVSDFVSAAYAIQAEAAKPSSDLFSTESLQAADKACARVVIGNIREIVAEAGAPVEPSEENLTELTALIANAGDRRGVVSAVTHYLSSDDKENAGKILDSLNTSAEDQAFDRKSFTKGFGSLTAIAYRSARLLVSEGGAPVPVARPAPDAPVNSLDPRVYEGLMKEPLAPGRVAFTKTMASSKNGDPVFAVFSAPEGTLAESVQQLEPVAVFESTLDGHPVRVPKASWNDAVDKVVEENPDENVTGEDDWGMTPDFTGGSSGAESSGAGQEGEDMWMTSSFTANVEGGPGAGQSFKSSDATSLDGSQDDPGSGGGGEDGDGGEDVGERFL